MPHIRAKSTPSTTTVPVRIRSTRKNKAYQIVVGAEIGERFAAAFEGMEVRIAEGRTIIEGEVVDQSHLHGILDRINALGMDLFVSVPED